ncbi:hypothetical protein METBIDRAFT_13913 [Metschnikowia bicuspidata var. bicuspidata NRRL YB-4993]|uniref:Uncharacterized protein n=1 Tax=Metschnikowia bicuspidata var. bicuspidata NRRL YB-4993 TaxID=869754 RepID=A0A1A0H1U2_9ASCO|nr:hypothetical protein METBIDRAFT_13913 [Metschnikowia bicuspidata var. bicuspidata NRRL YB-4993]OBA17999.1 hypothetical protein METBIDRAFT_13913 [Metschnikowia bicuspidata var. bicuspidata NRRL YB-4993]
MTLNQANSTGIYRHIAPMRDKQKPNCLFSSDIPYKISSCVAKLHLYKGDYSNRRVDLAEYIQWFDITLELNTLLLRNMEILPSELARINSMFVAEGRAPESSHSIRASSPSIPAVWRAILFTKKNSETFVVNFRLDVDQFLVDLSNISDMCLHFHANETIQPLLLLDIANHLKTYVQHKLQQELNNNNDISFDITNSSTILQDLPPNESIALFKAIYTNTHNEALDLAITSLDECDLSYVIEKQLIYYVDDEFDNTDDEMKLLHSDESGKSQLNEDEDLDFAETNSFRERIFVDYQAPEFLANEISSISLSENLVLSSAAKATKTGSNDQFFDIPNVDSKGREEVQESKSADALRECTKYSESDEGVTLSNTEHASAHSQQMSVHDGILVYENNSSLDERLKEIPAYTTECQDTIQSPMVSPKKKDNQSYGSETTGEENLLRKKASISFIDHDESLGLQFAFRDSSSSVPEYIKENKKFKFIKVGKVQKFVNMFEEHKEIASNPLSRVGTRPGSPVSRID